jgi:hypothetical protein
VPNQPLHEDDPDFIPPTAHQIQQEIMDKETRLNERRERRDVAAANRRSSIPEPKPGDKMFIIPQRGIKQRSRAGLRFDGSAGKRTEVDIVDLSDADVAKAQAAGKMVVNPWGAERILADNALTAHQSPAIEQDAARLQSENEDLRKENEAMRAEITKAKAARDARRAAKDPGDGSSSRLAAGAAVTGPVASTEADDFGAPQRK